MSHSVRAVFMSSHEILKYLSEVVIHPRSAARSHTNNKKCGSSHCLEVCVPASKQERITVCFGGEFMAGSLVRLYMTLH